MVFSIIGSHVDGAYTASEEPQTRQEAIDLANQLQRASDAKGYAERFTVYNRGMEIYRTSSHPATFYHVYSDTFLGEFTDLDTARSKVADKKKWTIYRTSDYRLIDSRWESETETHQKTNQR